MHLGTHKSPLEDTSVCSAPTLRGGPRHPGVHQWIHQVKKASSPPSMTSRGTAAGHVSRLGKAQSLGSFLQSK